VTQERVELRQSLCHPHLSQHQIRRSAGRLEGKRMALAGLTLGYSGVVITALLILIPKMIPPRTGIKATPVGCLRTINTAGITYASTYKKHGYSSSLSDLRDLLPGEAPSPQAAGLIDKELASGTGAGYAFIYTPGEKGKEGCIMTYTVHADPITPEATDVNHYFTDQSGGIRQESGKQATAMSVPIPYEQAPSQ
jgi:hypothetical protein